MKIKICGLSRPEDAAYVNEAGIDYAGFVFAQSRRQVSPAQAARLRALLDKGILAVGVFVNAPAETIIALYRDGVIDIAQLHGEEDEAFIVKLKEASAGSRLAPVPVIKVIKNPGRNITLPITAADYFLIDSGAGSGKKFDWALLKTGGLSEAGFSKPWFLAGGISSENIGEAMALNPYALDISSGAETDGVKDRNKILRLAAAIRKGSVV